MSFHRSPTVCSVLDFELAGEEMTLTQSKGFKFYNEPTSSPVNSAYAGGADPVPG
jgi:hypothetical protein